MINVHECCYKLLKKQYKVLLAHESGVIKNRDVEDVHQMRVVVRRIRAAIKSFRLFIDAEFRDFIKQDLINLAKKLGSVRDIDVAVIYFSEYLVKNPENNGVKYLVKSFLKRRKELHKELKAFLKSKEYKKIKKNLRSLISNMRNKSVKESGVVFYPQFYSNFEKIIDEVYSFKDVENLKQSDKDLHALRIAIKYLRYNMEFLNLKKKKAKKLLVYFKRIQEVLGIINDHDLINEKLYLILKEEGLSEEYNSGIQALIDYNINLKELEKSKISFPWEKLEVETLKNIYKPG